MQSQRFSRSLISQGGFTMIEMLIGILIIAATASTVFYGVSYSRGEIRKIVIRERALEELSGYMEFWIAMIHYGELSPNDENGDSFGEEVVLYEPFLDEGNTIIATIYRERIEQHYSMELNPNSTPYYTLRARIEWTDHLAKDELSELYLEVDVNHF